LLNPPVSIWRDHRDLVLIAIALLILQTLSIAALLWQRRRRRAAERNVLAHGVELARATRVAALGELSASIAHEIRQPLGAILSNADAADMLLDAERIDLPQLREILADIRRDDLRAHEVIRRLRALLQMKQVEHALLAVHEACDEALKLITADAARSEVRIERHYAASDDQIVGDRIQLQQVLINLVRNGIEAVDGLSPERRVVIVGTSERDGGVVMSVTDRGPGVREADRARLFDAFFTTKANGMGMGLSIVRSIVDAHHGTVQVDATAEGGSVFKVWWPRSSEPSTLSPAIDTTVIPAPA
jgi:signal transduction histidine kinase